MELGLKIVIVWTLLPAAVERHIWLLLDGVSLYVRERAPVCANPTLEFLPDGYLFPPFNLLLLCLCPFTLPTHSPLAQETPIMIRPARSGVRSGFNTNFPPCCACKLGRRIKRLQLICACGQTAASLKQAAQPPQTSFLLPGIGLSLRPAKPLKNPQRYFSYAADLLDRSTG